MCFKNVRIEKRVSMAFGVIFALLAVNTAVAIYLLGVIGHHVDHGAFKSLPYLAAAVAIGILTAVFIAREITKPLRQRVDSARKIADGPLSRAENAVLGVSALGNTVRKIGRATEAITEISEQTHLLALNARIEAARAGEAGKGFAVVAQEIKERARQTAEAADEIRLRIQGIQELTEKANQSASVAGEIAVDISEANTATAEMTNSSSQVNVSAVELSKLAEQLNQVVGRLKV